MKAINPIAYYLFAMLVFVNVTVDANEGIETNSTDDIALASVWAVSQVSAGAYGKLGGAASRVLNDESLLWEMEGAWMFNSHIAFGANLRGSFNEIGAINDRIVSFGVLFSWHNYFKPLGTYSLDFKVGAITPFSTDNQNLMIEPGIVIANRNRFFLKKHSKWYYGLSYRWVEDNDVAVFGSDSESSVNLNFGLLFGKF